MSEFKVSMRPQDQQAGPVITTFGERRQSTWPYHLEGHGQPQGISLFIYGMLPVRGSLPLSEISGIGFRFFNWYLRLRWNRPNDLPPLFTYGRYAPNYGESTAAHVESAWRRWKAEKKMFPSSWKVFGKKGEPLSR